MDQIQAISKNYKPMHFKFLGIRRKERLPRAAGLLKPISLIMLHAKTILGRELTYFDLRPSMTPEQRKTGDMQFLTHFDRSHDSDAENASRTERVRYYWLKMRYLPEIMHILGQLYDKNQQPITNLPEYVEMYLLRWHYMLSVRPDFVELVHGMEPQRAKQSVLNLL